jgi:DNA-binding MarR family transcriptional regulator
MAAVGNCGTETRFGGRFFAILSRIFEEHLGKLSPYEIAVYAVLAYHAGAPNELGERISWPSYDTIAAESGMKRTRAIKAVKLLEAAGLIRVAACSNGHGNTSNRYTLTVDPVPTPETQRKQVQRVLRGGKIVHEDRGSCLSHSAPPPVRGTH